MLPQWLVQECTYNPPHDRDAFLQRNVLKFASLLSVFHDSSAPHTTSVLDMLLSRVSSAVRLLGALLFVTLISVSRNIAFCWVVLAGFLVVIALRPARSLVSLISPALVLTVLAFLVNLPAALWLNQTQAPLRMALKTFLTVGIASNLAYMLRLQGILSALRTLHLPSSLLFTIELAIRDLGLLGESAHSLTESLALRSIGQNKTKTASTAGIIGAVFVRSQHLATSQAEAMLLRGYSSATSYSDTLQLSLADGVYIIFCVCSVTLFIYLNAVL